MRLLARIQLTVLGLILCGTLIFLFFARMLVEYPDDHDIDFDVDPSGRSIILSIPRKRNLDLFRIDLRTKTLSDVTSTPAHEFHPSFAPHGGAIVFSRAATYDGPSHIVERDLSTSMERVVTGGKVRDMWPEYLGTPARLAFMRGARFVPYQYGLAGAYWTDWCVMQMGDTGVATAVTRKADRRAESFAAASTAWTFSYCAQTPEPASGWQVFMVHKRGQREPVPIDEVPLYQVDISDDGVEAAFSGSTGVGSEADIRLWKIGSPRSTIRSLGLAARFGVLGRPRFSARRKSIFFIGWSLGQGHELHLWEYRRDRGQVLHVARIFQGSAG